MNEALRREMVSVECPRMTRFRYRGEYRVQQTRRSAQVGWGGESRGCYRGLGLSALFTVCSAFHTTRVVDTVKCWGLTSRAWTESEQGPRGAWNAETGGGRGVCCHSRDGLSRRIE